MKKLLTFLLLGIFLINLVSAGLFDPNSELQFHEESKNGKYGYYEINDTDFWFFNNKPVKTIELIENEYSVFTAWNIKEIKVFKPTKLFDKTNYLDKEQKNDKSNLLSSELHLYREWETKIKTINNQECSNYETSINGTKECSEWLDTSYKEIYEDWSSWKLYNFQSVQEGLYQTKTIVTRTNQGTGVIDWVDENEGWDLKEWLTWWDQSWGNRKNITITEGNIATRKLKPTETNLTNLTLGTNNCSKEIRILNENNAIVPVQIINNGGQALTMGSQWCEVLFLSNVTKGTAVNYSVYYNNPLATKPSYTKTSFSATSGLFTFDSGYFDGEMDSTLGTIDTLTTIGGISQDLSAETFPSNTLGVYTSSVVIENGDVRSRINISNANIWATLTIYQDAEEIYLDTEHSSGVYYYSTDLVPYASSCGNESNVLQCGTDGQRAVSERWFETNNSNAVVYTAWNNLDYFYDTVAGRWAWFYDGSPRGASTGSLYFGMSNETTGWEYARDQYLASLNPVTITLGDGEILGARISLIEPEDNLQTTETNQTFRCNASLNSNNISNLTFILNGVETLTNSTIGTFIDLTYSQNITTEGIYNWSCKAITEIGIITQTANRTLTIHFTEPKVIIHNPEPIIDYHLLGNNLTLNWTITETGENLTSHIKNCTYEYNGVLTILNNTVCTQINQTEFLYVLGVNNLTFNVTDIFDLVNSTLVQWSINLTEINQTYNNQTLEGATQIFSSMIRLGTGQSISAAALIYNETITAGTNIQVGENRKIQLENFIIPQVTTDTNITFYWSIVLSGGEIINLTSQNQTIKNIALDNCSSFSNAILNITMVDEEKQTLLSNTSIEVAINLLSVDRTQTVVSLSGSFENENPLGICLSENITNDIMYSLDAVFKYTSNGYAIEYYNLVNSSLDNDTTTQSITLYNLNASDSTDFQLTFTGEDFLPVENALVFIERQYIAENTFKTVELPKTDSNGQTILHLVRNDIVYNIRVVKDGVILSIFNNIIAFCEDFTIGACSLPLNAISNISLVFNYDDEIGLIFQENTQYNETTGLASFSFASTDGTTKVVNMRIERRDVFGNRSVCENTLVSSAGSISCQVDPEITDTSLISIISVDGEDKINSEIIIDSTAYGQNGYAMFFIFAVGMFLMFSGSKTWTLVGVSLEYIVGVSLGMIVGGIAGVGSTGIFVLIISVVGIWQLNKERKQ